MGKRFEHTFYQIRHTNGKLQIYEEKWKTRFMMHKGLQIIDPQKGYTKAHYNKTVKSQRKERILKAAREKQIITQDGIPIDY